MYLLQIKSLVQYDKSIILSNIRTDHLRIKRVFNIGLLVYISILKMLNLIPYLLIYYVHLIIYL